VSADLAAVPFIYVALLAFWTVLVAELVGDKSIYTIASLASRFPARIIVATMVLAFAGKMFAAVLLGQFVVRLHSPWTDAVSAVAFFSSALFIWWSESEPVVAKAPVEAHRWQATAICLGSLFFTEWGDPGQIAVLALTVKSHSLLAPWLGGTLAMAVKGGLALLVGFKLRKRLPQPMLRALASASCCVLGFLALRNAVFS